MSLALNAVYNNYLAAYAPKSLTRYDTHKKSELRNVYNTIVKQTKDAPWYLPTTDKATQQYAVDLKENARELKNTIAQLGGLEENGLLSQKRAYSSDEGVLTASYIGSQEPDGEIPDFRVEVKALASPQENLGLYLPDEKVSLAPGTYSFDVAINDLNYEFQFTINDSETNREVQERLARLISNAGIGLKASVAESEGRTALRLTSEATGLSAGKEQLFSVSDHRTSKTAGTVQYFGLDYTTRQPSNARLLVNGEDYSASSNHFTISKLFEVELKGVSEDDKPAQIGLKTDTDSLTDNIGQLVDSYNRFVQTAASYPEKDIRTKQLISELKAVVGFHGSSLEPLGITAETDGSLKMDKNLMRKAALESEDIFETFSPLKSFSSELLRKSNQVSLNPMNYVQKTVVAYKNPGHTYVSPYNASAYSGMMFNSYC